MERTTNKGSYLRTPGLTLYTYIPHRQPGYLLYFRGEFLIHSPSLIPTTRPRPRGSFIRPANYELEANVEPVKLRGSSAAWGEGCTRAPVSSCACGLRRSTPPRALPRAITPSTPTLATLRFIVSLSSTSSCYSSSWSSSYVARGVPPGEPPLRHPRHRAWFPLPAFCVSFSNFPLVNVNRCWSINWIVIFFSWVNCLVKRIVIWIFGYWLVYCLYIWNCVFFVCVLNSSVVCILFYPFLGNYGIFFNGIPVYEQIWMVYIY